MIQKINHLSEILIEKIEHFNFYEYSKNKTVKILIF